MFISFEGLDGSGKTTQIQLLKEFLETKGYDVLMTREPGGTAIGNQIRDVLHSLDNTAMHPRTELLLYVASRAQLVAEVIRPRLAAEQMILCDRFADSTIAYQGYGHGLDIDALKQILHFATGGLQPELTFYLDITAQGGLERRRKAAECGEEWNRLDAFALEFHKRVQDGYAELIEEEPERWVIIEANQEINRIQSQMREALLSRLDNQAE